MLRIINLAISLLVSAISPLTSAGDWYEYKSDNFKVYSDVSSGNVKELLSDMEAFRQTVLLFTGLEDQPENQQLEIFYFYDADEFFQFSGSRRIAGFYKDTWNGPLIFSQKGRWGMSGVGIMFHEYVHHLMRERSRAAYPMWYSEGFAELLASTDISERRVIIGKFPEWRESALVEDFSAGRRLNIRELLQPDLENDSNRYWNSFYATAWQFTHYLQLGAQSAGKDYREATRKYLLAVTGGENPIKSFEPCFGKAPEDMDRELRQFSKSKQLRGYKFEVPAYGKQIQMRKLGNNERYFILADRALDIGKEELALDYLGKTDEKAPGWQANLSLIAVLHNHHDEDDSIPDADTIARIESSNSRDYRVAANLSHYYADRLQTLDKTGKWDKALYEKATHYGRIAVEENSAYLPGYRYLWTAYKHDHAKMAALKTMMEAYQIDPQNLFLNQEIGFFLANVNREDLAEPYLQRVVAWSHPGETRSAATKILDSLRSDGAEASDKKSEVADSGE